MAALYPAYKRSELANSIAATPLFRVRYANLISSPTDGGQGMYSTYSEGMWESAGVSINNIKFSFGSGNIASGIFKLYGIE